MTFVKALGLQSAPAYEADEVIENIKASLRRPFPMLQDLPEFGKPKGDTPIALVGGGPSLNDHLTNLRKMNCIMVCGSPHDHLRAQGISPRYCVAADAHPTITALYLKDPDPLTTYLIATQCAETVFQALQGHSVAMWHCTANASKAFLDDARPGWMGVDGGCTVGLRALRIAMLLGFRNIHLFGFDSCFSDSETHAFKMQLPGEEHQTQEVFEVSPGVSGPSAKSYICYGYHLIQARDFDAFFNENHKLVDLTFYGDGLLRHMHGIMLSEFALRDKIAEKAA